MSRYAALDLQSLPPPSGVVEVDFAAALEARLKAFRTAIRVLAPGDADEIIGIIDNLESDPLRAAFEAGAAREVHVNAQINSAVKSVMLATATGADLDHKGATRQPPVYRKDGETDMALRARIQLAAESRSPHGPEGAYVFWALAASDAVRDAAAYGPESNVDPRIAPAHVDLVIDVADSAEAAATTTAVYEYATADDRRPVGDVLRVVAAEPVVFNVRAELVTVTPVGAEVAIQGAAAALAGAMDQRRQIGRPIYLSSIIAALNVSGAHDVRLLEPIEDVSIGPYQTAVLGDSEITATAIAGGWRDV